LPKNWEEMKKRFFNSRGFRQLLSILGFGSAAFVFSACYGPVPRQYQDGAYADSVSETLSATLAAEDSLSATLPDAAVTDSIQ
jgi:uncharacterized membrane protein